MVGREKERQELLRRYQRKLANRQAIIQKLISPKQVIRHTLITTYGLTQNEYKGVFSNVVTLEGLFLI